MNRASPLSQPTRALLHALLRNHSVDDTFALLRCTVRDEPVTRRQVVEAATRGRAVAPCNVCAGPVSKQSKSGMCKSCATQALIADPAARARRIAGLRIAKAKPEHRERARAATIATHEARKSDPAWQEYKHAGGKRIGAYAAQSAEVKAAAAEGRRRSAARRAARHYLGIPQVRHDELKRLARSYGYAEARRIIIADLTPFERQLAKVAGGAALVMKQDFRSAPSSYSLVGNATGML